MRSKYSRSCHYYLKRTKDKTITFLLQRFFLFLTIWLVSPDNAYMIVQRLASHLR